MHGESSRGLRAILADESPDVLPVPLLGRVGEFVMHTPFDDDVPTQVRPPPVAVTAVTEPRVAVWMQWAIAMSIGGLIVWGLTRLF